MAITPSTLQAYPEFASVPDATIQNWIDNAPAHIDGDAYGDATDQATTMWVAHQITLMKIGGGVGQGSVISATVGGVNVQFAGDRTMNPVDWDATAWGRILLMISKVRAQSAGLVI